MITGRSISPPRSGSSRNTEDYYATRVHELVVKRGYQGGYEPVRDHLIVRLKTRLSRLYAMLWKILALQILFDRFSGVSRVAGQSPGWNTLVASVPISPCFPPFRPLLPPGVRDGRQYGFFNMVHSN